MREKTGAKPVFVSGFAYGDEPFMTRSSCIEPMYL